MFNPAHGEKGPVGDAIRSLFALSVGDVRLGDGFVIGQRKTAAGERVLAVLSRGTDGTWSTIAVIDRSGNLSLAGTVAAPQDMAALGYNFTRVF